MIKEHISSTQVLGYIAELIQEGYADICIKQDSEGYWTIKATQEPAAKSVQVQRNTL